tara:strand:+ start:947 stop:1090 length:144 start_codon:yes stop_codon:yes gene_type:complete
MTKLDLIKKALIYKKKYQDPKLSSQKDWNGHIFITLMDRVESGDYKS